MAAPPICLSGRSFDEKDFGDAGLNPVLSKELVEGLWILDRLDRAELWWVLDLLA